MYLYQLNIVIITKALRTTVLGIRDFYQQSSSSICPVRQYSWPDIYNGKSCAVSCSILVITTYHARAARYLTCLKIKLVAMLRPRPTQIRPSIHEYLSPGRRREMVTTGYAFKTHWTRAMLLRLRKLDDTGLSDEDILATLKEEYGGPDAVNEIWQERSLLAMGPRNDGTWNTAMENLVVEMVKAGKTVMEITMELLRLYQRPGAWAETYRKIQQLKLNKRIE
ncbi:hypothetical protein XPA_003087 [Xanthoria parietina]